MPGMYAPGHYDLAGFCVGVVERDRIIDGTQIQAGDALIGIPSSGIHSNGYSLVRKIWGSGLGQRLWAWSTAWGGSSSHPHRFRMQDLD